jgi:hypothetical protein
MVTAMDEFEQASMRREAVKAQSLKKRRRKKKKKKILLLKTQVFTNAN